MVRLMVRLELLMSLPCCCKRSLHKGVAECDEPEPRLVGLFTASCTWHSNARLSTSNLIYFLVFYLTSLLIKHTVGNLTNSELTNSIGFLQVV